jgi:sterol carrier protein 2
MTGIPIINVNNNCATGSTALYLAHNAIKGGLVKCAMAVGFEKMQTGSLPASHFPDRTNPLDKHFLTDLDIRGESKSNAFAPRLFGNAGREHMEKYGTKPEHFAKIAEKNHRHSANNPYS